MTDHHRLEKSLAALWPPDQWREVPVVVAVSGGCDSVALLHALLRLAERGAGRLIVGHFQHGLRGAESEADQQFVTDLAQRLDLACHVGRGEITALADRQGDGLEAAARQARYEFLIELARQSGARYVALGHTADDQAETILHHILRGTGLAGLAGMPAARPLSPGVTLIRPLLEISRQDVEAYLHMLGQEYRRDTTNDDLRFTRNRLRHDLLPRLARDYHPGIRESLIRLGRLAAESHAVISDQALRRLAGHVQRVDRQTVAVDCSAVTDVAPGLLREMMVALWRQQSWPQQAMTFEHWEALGAMVRAAEVKARVFPGEVRAEKKGGQLILSCAAG